LPRICRQLQQPVQCELREPTGVPVTEISASLDGPLFVIMSYSDPNGLVDAAAQINYTATESCTNTSVQGSVTFGSLGANWNQQAQSAFFSINSSIFGNCNTGSICLSITAAGCTGPQLCVQYPGTQASGDRVGQRQ
jgi:hypothetical protein